MRAPFARAEAPHPAPHEPLPFIREIPQHLRRPGTGAPGLRMAQLQIIPQRRLPHARTRRHLLDGKPVALDDQEPQPPGLPRMQSLHIQPLRPPAQPPPPLPRLPRARCRTLTPLPRLQTPRRPQLRADLPGGWLSLHAGEMRCSPWEYRKVLSALRRKWKKTFQLKPCAPAQRFPFSSSESFLTPPSQSVLNSSRHSLIKTNLPVS